MPLTIYWQQVVDEYSSSDAYWFFPKGRQVDSEEFGKIVAIFAEFDGQAWQPQAILSRLHEENLSQGDAAVPRMIKRPVESMGLCVIDEQRGVFLTPLGRMFLELGADSALLERQLWRYELPNPLNPRAKGITLNPHAFLLGVMLSCGNYISHDEFVLFVAKSREASDLRKTVDRIRAWRRLNNDRQQEIKSALPPLYATIDGNSSYAMGFHRCASYILSDTRPGETRAGLRLDSTRVNWIRDRVRHSRVARPRIEFRTNTDWVAAHGGVDDLPSNESAVDYYLEISDPAKAVAAFRRLPPDARGGRTIADFSRIVFLEKDLEDFLEGRLDLIEEGLLAEWGGRQVQVGVGTMDLFARSANGDLVVIELKKARASDKVFGQICRYVGWIKSHYAAPGQRVRGYIIASEMDEKLKYASKATPVGKIRLKTFRRDAAAGVFIED